jgi:hypothetical protein
MGIVGTNDELIRSGSDVEELPANILLCLQSRR